MPKLEFIFCHGLSGWGEYDAIYKMIPYWGTTSCNILKELREQGYSVHGASVSPTGSAWDRACELYAEIAGVRTDYGRVHSKTYSHERYGPDFTGRPLIERFDENTKLVLFGHSFGGATVRLFSQLMADGSKEEQEGTHPKDLSPLFAGGMENRIFALITLAAPTNGTVSYDMYKDPSFDTEHVDLPLKYRMLSKMMSGGTRMKKDTRDLRDYANYDMEIDHAMALNDRIRTLKNTYYFSAPCVSSMEQPDGTHLPDLHKTEGMFVRSSTLMGRYQGVTKNGFVIDESWRKNDGLVNTVSARAPLGAPQKPFDENNIEKGIWNVFEDYDGDHASLQGGFAIRHNPMPFYEKTMAMIRDLFEKEQ